MIDGNIFGEFRIFEQFGGTCEKNLPQRRIIIIAARGIFTAVFQDLLKPARQFQVTFRIDDLCCCGFDVHAF